MQGLVGLSLCASSASRLPLSPMIHFRWVEHGGLEHGSRHVINQDIRLRRETLEQFGYGAGSYSHTAVLSRGDVSYSLPD